MRIRSIKPEFWRSDDIAALPISARLLFVGLWSYVDDNGVGSDKVSSVAADLFAADLEADPTETFRRVSADTTRLSEQGLIVRFEANGKPLLYITNWERHQLVKNPSKGKLYPLPSGEMIDAANARRRPYGDSTETLGTGTGEQGNRGTGEQGILLSDPNGSNAEGELLSPDWLPTQKHFDHATSLGLDPEFQLARFRQHAHEKQRRMKNWNTAFTNWLKKGAEMAQQRQASGAPIRPAVSQRPNAVDMARAFAADLATGGKELEA